MKNNLIFKRLDKSDITEAQFKQIVEVEQSDGNDGYTEEQLKSIWIEDKKDDNFVCIHNNKIVAHISFNPKSKRRNGSVYMVNLMVSPEYRKMGIAQNLIFTACKFYMQKGETLPMSLSVDKDNTKAINLYQKVGYEIKDPICEVDEDDEQYIMEVSLPTLKQNLKNLLGLNEKVKQ